MASRYSGPPLVTWPLCFIVCGLLIAGFHWQAANFEPPPSDAFVSYNRDRLKAFRQAAAMSNKPTVLLLGNSTLRYATDIDHETWEFQNCDTVQVLRICNNWARFIDFAALTDELLELQPALIVIQPELIGRTRLKGIKPAPEELQTYVSWKLFGVGEWDPLNQDQEEVQIDQGNYNDQSDRRFQERVKKLTEWQGIDLDSESARQAYDFLVKANKQGCQIVLLWTPVTKRVTPYIEGMRGELQPIVTEYSKLGSQLIEYPGQLRNGSFTDFVHLNESGRTKFMDWFVPEILSLVEER